MNSATKNILICGVGGQGILLATEIIASALVQSGYDVKQSEIHGMAQRGGSVVAHLRFGKRVYSPLIEHGTADLVVSFEMMESVRYIPFMHRHSLAIVNTQKIYPSSVSRGDEEYPDDLPEQFASRKIRMLPVDALDIAASLGETRSVNLVLAGAMSGFLHVDEKIFLSVMKKRLPAKIYKVNSKAFSIGRKLGTSYMEGKKPL